MVGLLLCDLLLMATPLVGQTMVGTWVSCLLSLAVHVAEGHATKGSLVGGVVRASVRERQSMEVRIEISRSTCWGTGNREQGSGERGDQGAGMKKNGLDDIF